MLGINRSRALAVVSIAATVVFFALCGTALAQGDVEPNDTPAQASLLTLPFTSVRGTVSNEQDIDYYKFTASAGEEIAIIVQAFSNGSELMPILALYDSDGTLIAYNDKEWNFAQGRFFNDPILYLKMPQTGSYFISVSSSGRFRNGPFVIPRTAGPYTLYLVTKFFGGSPDDRNEPNDTLQTATPVSLPYKSFGAHLIQFGDIDWYRFSANRGELISVDIDALERVPGPSFEITVAARVGLFDDAGRLLKLASIAPDPDTGFNGDPVITFEVPKDGKYYVAVAESHDTDFDSPFNDPGFLSNPYVGSATHGIGYYQLEIRVLRKLYFAQIANGDFGSATFKTGIIVVNFSPAAVATGSVNFYNSDGSPLVTSLTSGAPPASTYYFRIPPKASVLIQTDGSGPAASGYAVVIATRPVGGSAIFSQYDPQGTLVTEAGVADSPPLDFLTVPVDVTGDFNTGVAIANAKSATTANLFMKLVSTTGSAVASRSMTLAKGQKIALFVSGVEQLFPGVTNFRGSLQVFADTPVNAVALRSSSRTITTLPPVSLNQPFDPVTLYFPQVVVGAAANTYSSSIILTNPGFFSASGTVRFTRSDGSPLVVEIGSSNSSLHTFTIPPQGAIFLTTTPVGALESGYAVVEADHGIGGVVIFSQFDRLTGNLQTEAAVQAAQRYTRFLIFAQVEEGYNTGLAVANITPGNSELDYKLKETADPEVILERGPLALNAGRHRAELVAGPGQIFPAFAGRGTMEVTSSVAIPAVALRLTATTMTAIPVVPIP